MTSGRRSRPFSLNLEVPRAPVFRLEVVSIQKEPLKMFGVFRVFLYNQPKQGSLKGEAPGGCMK